MAGVGPSSGLAEELARALNAKGIAFAPDDGTGPPTPDAARGRRLVWGNHWEMYEAYRARQPYASWRSDLLWAYVEEGSRQLPDGRLELVCTGETEASYLERAAPAREALVIEASPLVRPVAVAEALRDLLSGLD